MFKNYVLYTFLMNITKLLKNCYTNKYLKNSKLFIKKYLKHLYIKIIY